MKNQEDLFLSYSSTTWTGLSSIVTLLAVLVAIFLPFILDQIKRSNVKKSVEIETKYNLNLLLKAESCKNGNLNGQLISRINLMVAMLVNLRVDVWEDNKQIMAGISSELFAKNYEINNLIKDIQKQSNEIYINKGNSPWVAILEDEVKKCISLITK